MKYLDNQHRGKPKKPDDLGAAYDVDGDGDIEHEALLVDKYMLAAETILRTEHGLQVMPISTGSYRERHAWVNADARGRSGTHVYVAGHLNAGAGAAQSGDYGSIFYDHRSTSGRALAESIAVELRDLCPELARVIVRPASPGDWTRNAYGTISGIGKPVAVCFEPAFMTCKAHAPLFTDEGLTRIGSALAAGIQSWLSS